MQCWERRVLLIVDMGRWEERHCLLCCPEGQRPRNSPVSPVDSYLNARRLFPHKIARSASHGFSKLIFGHSDETKWKCDKCLVFAILFLRFDATRANCGIKYSLKIMNWSTVSLCCKSFDQTSVLSSFFSIIMYFIYFLKVPRHPSNFAFRI